MIDDDTQTCGAGVEKRRTPNGAADRHARGEEGNPTSSLQATSQADGKDRLSFAALPLRPVEGLAVRVCGM